MVEESVIPDWNVIEKLFTDIDNTITDAVEKNANFIEVDIALMMVNEKIRQQKHYMYNILDKEDNDKPKDKTHNIYG